MSRNRNHIDSKVLAQAAKWSKPKLRKKYTYAPKKITVGKYLKESNDPKLQRKYARYMKKEVTRKKSITNMDGNNKVYNKWESMNNFSNLKTQNMEFANEKNRARRKNKLAKLDNLAWESVAIPENDSIFGSIDGKGNECGVGQLQVISSKDFFANYDANDLKIEEYVLDSNAKHVSQNKSVYDDRMGLKEQLDINRFNSDTSELLQLIQFSLHKLDSDASQSSFIIDSKSKKTKHKKLQKRKTMKQKAEDKQLQALQRKFDEANLLKTQEQINEEVCNALQINAGDLERRLKWKMKQKWKQGRIKKLEFAPNEPPMKKRKLNHKKGEFRKQIQNLHEKQNIKQITKTWNVLLNAANNKTDADAITTSDNQQLMSHLVCNNTQNVIKIASVDELTRYKSDNKIIVIGFYDSYNVKLDTLAVEYGHDIIFMKMQDVHLKGVIAQKYRIYVVPTFIFLDRNQNEIARIEDDDINTLKTKIDRVLAMKHVGKKRLHPLLLRGIAYLGFNDATKIQKEVIPLAANGSNDVLIAAATGSGKTLSFGIPIINDLLYNELNPDLYGLIITPTRELAIQIESHFKSLCKYSTIQCVAIVGGMCMAKQHRLLRSSPEIIVATPGRIWQLMHDKQSLHLRDLSKLRYLVLDEADRLLSSNHYIQLNHILSMIKTIWSINDYKQRFPREMPPNISATQENNDNNNYNLMAFLETEDNEASDLEDYKDIDDIQMIEDVQSTRKDATQLQEKKIIVNELAYRRQTFVVSATLTLESVNRQKKTESKMPIFANLATLVPFQDSIKMVDQTPRHRTTFNVMEYEIALVSADKDAMCAYLLQVYRGRTLLFSNTIGTVKRITLILKELGFTAYCIHSQQQQRQRLKNLDRFVKTAKCVLICTDICARGLDIPSVDNIIHFQCPLSAEDYIHRTGRIGRHETNKTEIHEKDGNSFLLMCAQESKLYNKIILALKRPQGLSKLTIREMILLQIRKQTTIAKRIAAVLDDTRRIHRKTANLQKMADAAGIELDEINCRALNIMKTNENQRNNRLNMKRKYSKRKKHKSFEYGVNNGKNQIVNKTIKSLRNELKLLKSHNDLRRPKSSYLTKTYVPH